MSLHIPATTVALQHGRNRDIDMVTVPCEPINNHLAITPVIDVDDNGKLTLAGVFAITHRPTGYAISDGSACINCCRSASTVLTALGIDWAAITKDNTKEVLSGLDEDTRLRLNEARQVGWYCDAEDCAAWGMSTIDAAVAEQKKARAARETAEAVAR